MSSTPSSKVEVSVVTLDSLRFGGAVAFLKVDTEGSDLEALRGAERMITEHRPKIQVETHRSEDLPAASAWLEERGYQLETVRSWILALPIMRPKILSEAAKERGV